MAAEIVPLIPCQAASGTPEGPNTKRTKYAEVTTKSGSQDLKFREISNFTTAVYGHFKRMNRESQPGRIKYKSNVAKSLRTLPEEWYDMYLRQTYANSAAYLSPNFHRRCSQTATLLVHGCSFRSSKGEGWRSL